MDIGAKGRLAGRIALVTGSSTGIGAAIARRFAAEDARVMVHGLDAAEAEGVVAEIDADGRGEAAMMAADLADPSSAARLVEATVDRWGGLDILVNNAAVSARSDIETTSAAVFDAIVALNLRAPLLLIQSALPHLKRAAADGTGAAILNIGSVNGYCGERNLLAYSISKGGLMTLSRNLADAFAPDGIRVTHFNLGWVLTENEYALKRREGFPEDWATRLPRSTVPSGRLLAPEEIAHWALAFVEKDGGPVSGSVVDLDQFPRIGRNPEKAPLQL